MYISAPPTETSLGVLSMLYPGILRSVVKKLFCLSLLSNIQIISALLDNKVINIFRSSICDESEDMFKYII